MATICIFGDSITWGAVDPEQGGWASRLRNHFESQGLSVDMDVDVYNLGISGDNTDDLKVRFEIEAQARKPDTIIFAIGINDAQFLLSKQDNRVPIAAFSKNMTELLHRAKEIATRVIVIGITRVDETKTTPIPWRIDKEYRNSHIDRYDTALRELAEAHEVPYVDVSTALTLEDLADGLHPNTAGHKKLFEIIKEKVS